MTAVAAAVIGLNADEASQIREDEERLDRIAHSLWREFNRTFHCYGGSTSHGGWSKESSCEQGRWRQTVITALERLTIEEPLSNKDPRNQRIGFNVGDAESIASDDEYMIHLALWMMHRYERAMHPGIGHAWDDVQLEHQLRWLRVAKELVMRLVIDYTTPDCGCKYCSLDPEVLRAEPHGKPLMCQTRWWAMPAEARREISESIRD